MSSIDPLAQVRASCSRVMKSAEHVRVVDSRIDAVAQELFENDFTSAINGVQVS